MALSTPTPKLLIVNRLIVNNFALSLKSEIVNR